MIDVIKDADVIVITAGAGMSVDSTDVNGNNLPDFRGDVGMWKAYPALGNKNLKFAEIANPKAFDKNPELAWAFYGHRFDLYKNATPHAGYKAILELAKQKEDYFVVTSNVDGQFQKAGFDKNKIYEVHGRINQFQCTACNNVWAAPKHTVFNINPKTLNLRGPIPKCKCGATARPNIMMFNDTTFNSASTIQQAKDFNTFMAKYDKGHNIVIVEFGAGKAIPTIRKIGNNIHSKVKNATLVRINPRESQGPTGTISIDKTAVDAVAEDLVSEDIKKLFFIKG
jgi:NAD-dependent SIR2 family protein deacetylase